MKALTLSDLGTMQPGDAGPWRKLATITKSDSTVYDPPIRGLRVASAGDVAVVDLEGNSVTIPSVLAGEILPGFFTKVLSTGTTASGFTAGF